MRVMLMAIRSDGRRPAPKVQFARLFMPLVVASLGGGGLAGLPGPGAKGAVVPDRNRRFDWRDQLAKLSYVAKPKPAAIELRYYRTVEHAVLYRSWSRGKSSHPRRSAPVLASRQNSG